jgi:tetratricopeptide (TPR) repeat protein
MESALQSRDDSLPPDEQQEENRIDRNLKQLVRAAKSLHSDASTVIITGAGSSVWGGSIMGEPLSQDTFNQIEAWIPPPSHEEPERQDGLSPRPTSPSPAIWPDSSDSESDIEKDIMKKFEELAAAKFATKDYEKAATLLRKLVDYSFRNGKSQEEITKIEIKLACVYGLQSKWQEAEAITVRTTGSTGNGEVDKVLFHVLHALALLYLRENNFELARKHCKGAIKGKRKLLGRTHASSYESIALLACIYDATGDSAEAEGCRSLLPDDYSKDVDLQPVSYMSVNVPSIDVSSA